MNPIIIPTDYMKKTRCWLIVIFVLFVRQIDADPVVVYAAASLNSVVTEIMLKHSDGSTQISFASSSTLARQIQLGAPADIFFSANTLWMDDLVTKGLIEKSSRRNVLSNELVLITQSKSRITTLDWRTPQNFIYVLGKSRLAMGDPTHVPVGLYTREFFRKLGWWEQIKPRIASAPNVLAALNYVARGECELGVVYFTDTFLTNKVRIVRKVPKAFHSPITYSIGIVTGRERPQVRDVYEYVVSPSSLKLFTKKGFIVLNSEVEDADG